MSCMIDIPVSVDMQPQSFPGRGAVAVSFDAKKGYHCCISENTKLIINKIAIVNFTNSCLVLSFQDCHP